MSSLDLSIVGLYLGAMVVVGLWLQRRASSDIDAYFLGGRSIPWWALATSGMSSNLDVTGSMINTAMIFAMGVGGYYVEFRGGVTLVIAFLLAFMGKWNRRANVMTLAEWMVLRFGDGAGGRVARMIAAWGTIIITVAMVTYFCKGAGKFVALFLGFGPMWGMAPDFWAALLMMGLASLYTVASGLQGVVWTDVFQTGFIFITIVSICVLCMTSHPLPERFDLSVPLRASSTEVQQAGGAAKAPPSRVAEVGGKRYLVWSTTARRWTSLRPSVHGGFPPQADYSRFNLLWVLMLFYLSRLTLEGVGGVTGYMSQRYFAVASDREAGLMSLLWIVLLAFRWPFMAAVAVMGIAYAQTHGPIGDPELVLPTVVQMMVPTGLKGLLVAGLMAAAMSTFDSTVNAGASYWVRDIYQAFINPQADPQRLVWQSRLATLAIVAAGLIFSVAVRNINDIWGWITMGITAGMLVPQVIRWYWWRFNGWGFAVGTAGGMLAAILVKALAPQATPDYVTFSVVVLTSLVGAVVGTLLSAPAAAPVLDQFYRQTRPFGFWGPIRARLGRELDLGAVDRENRRDVVAMVVAVPWQIVLFLAGMMPIMRRWDQFALLLAAVALLSVLLHRVWYRHLDAGLPTPRR